MDQTDRFESVLSSLVSSPQASDAGAFNIPDGGMMRELIGRLGSICNSGFNNNNNSTNSSCYDTPLNSPSKLNLSMTDPNIKLDLPISMIHGNKFPSLVADPGFAERAARFSCFGGKNGQLMGLDGTELSYRSIMPTIDQSSVLPTNQSLKISEKKFINRSSSPEFGDSREGSSLSEQIPCGQSSGNRKRKSIPRGKAKETLSSTSAKNGKVENEETNAKRIKTADETFGNEKDKDTQKEKKANNSKPPEPPKDYIHVRARRGQATDSHSLAERVRREKISERMKYLQDLVPGCNKVTGKAVMLDEIINYVQSLQHQVEFLSMKLAIVNPRMDLNTEALLSKEIFQSHNHGVHSLDSSMSTSLPFGYHHQQVPNNISSGGETQFLLNPYLNIAVHPNSGIQFPPMDGLTAQVPTLFEDDLQSLVQTGLGPTSQPISNNGSMAASQ